MAIFSMRSKVIGRSAKGGGRSAVQCSAYQDRLRLTDLETGKTYDYTDRDSDLIHAEVSLPSNWKEEYRNPENLWNAVESKEGRKDARLARTFIFAIPKEMTDPVEMTDFCRDFIQETFVSVGMAVDWSIHDKHNGNPHMHAMAVLRTCKEDGSWASKERKAYRLDADGNRIPVTNNDGTQKVDSHGRKQWQRVTVSVNDWENLRCHSYEKWREAWEKACNDWLIPRNIDPIDHRSLRRQAFDKWQEQRVETGQEPGTMEEFKQDVADGKVYIPKATVHEGYWARKVEAEGGESPICEYNREVKVERSIMDWFKDKIEDLETGIEKISHSIEQVVLKIKQISIEALSGIFGKEDTSNVFRGAEKKTGISSGSGNDIDADTGDLWRETVDRAEIHLSRAETAAEMFGNRELEQDTGTGEKRERAVSAGEEVSGATEIEYDPVDQEDGVEGRIDAGL